MGILYLPYQDRGTGKTTKLTRMATDYLLQNPNANVGFISQYRSSLIYARQQIEHNLQAHGLTYTFKLSQGVINLTNTRGNIYFLLDSWLFCGYYFNEIFYDNNGVIDNSITDHLETTLITTNGNLVLFNEKLTNSQIIREKLGIK